MQLDYPITPIREIKSKSKSKILYIRADLYNPPVSTQIQSFDKLYCKIQASKPPCRIRRKSMNMNVCNINAVYNSPPFPPIRLAVQKINHPLFHPHRRPLRAHHHLHFSAAPHPPKHFRHQRLFPRMDHPLRRLLPPL